MQNIIEEEEINLNLFDTIRRYPFNGRSKYLIDKFYLIGYEYNLIHKLFIESQIKDLIKEVPKKEENSGFNDLLGNKKKQVDGFKSIKIKSNPPSILNEISSDYKKQMPDFDTIRSMIFPNGCEFYYSFEECKDNEEYKDLGENEFLRTTINSSITTDIGVGNEKKKNKRKKLPNSYNVVFSYNPQEGNNSKKSINGFSFVFYKRHNEGKISENKMYYFYIPYVFCILSEFPFYNSYYILCNQLYNLIKSKKVEIPLEIIIYNIVNFTLSPINSDVFLNLNAFNLPQDYVESELGEIKEDLELEIEQEGGDKDNIINNINKENNNNAKKNIENKKTSFREKKNNNNNNLGQIKTIKKGGNLNDISLRFLSSNSLWSALSSKTRPFPKIKFGLLSGYPLIQYNLVKVLLNKMSPADVITIFFYTFLEKSVIFFSKNIELLSLTINSYLNLNFPLNDEKYYFYNVSISYDNYMEGNSMFIGTTFTNVIGINGKYQSNYKNNHVRLAEHLTVDLDKGIINQVEDERENDNEERDNNIFEFFRQIYKNKEMKEEEKNSILYTEVKNIFDKLSFYKELFTRKTSKDKPDEYKKIINGNYIDYDDHEEELNSNKEKKYSIKYINRDIQESFYILVNNLCIYFYQNLSLRSYEDVKNKVENDKKESMNVIFNDEFLRQNNTYTQEEKDFLHELRETMKFQSFVYGFIQSYNPIDLYKIPLTFTEEFLSMLTTKSSIYNNIKNNIKFLSLIDSLYERQKRKDIYIDFNQFVNEYYKKYKFYIDREIYDNYDEDKLSIILKDDKNISVEGYKYLSFELNNYIIFQYKYMIDNLNKNDYVLLLNNWDVINDNIIQRIMTNDIENSIEKNLMEKGLLTADDICCSNIIFLFIISMKNIVMKFDYHIFLSSLFHQCKVFRKYYTMIIEVIYKLMKNSLEKKKYDEAENFLMSYYPFINSLRSLGLVPNENLINIIKKFHQVSIDELRNANNANNNIDVEGEKNEEKKEEEIFEDFKFENDYLYICKNFNYNKFIKEEDILKEINKLGKKEIILANKNDKIFKPKIKFNNGKEKYEFEVYSQMTIFEILSSQYIIYISSNLKDQFLNAEVIFPLCLNIMIYFRNMNIFDGKDEINQALIEMFSLFLNLYIKSKINNNNIII